MSLQPFTTFSFAEVQEIHQKYPHLNLIPLIKTVRADLDTPLSVYLKLTQQKPNSFLLESVVGGERFARYSFIGLPADSWVEFTEEGALNYTICNKFQEQQTTITLATIQNDDDILNAFEEFRQSFKAYELERLPRFSGGFAGYFAYDAVRLFEKKLQAQHHTDSILNTPDILFLLTKELAVMDHLTNQLHLISYIDLTSYENNKNNVKNNVNLLDSYQQALLRLEQMNELLQQPFLNPLVCQGFTKTEVVRTFAKDDYLKTVLSAKENVQKGDLMQIQIGQRLEKHFPEQPINLYRALRSLNPSPYLYYYHFKTTQEFFVVGASPEILVRQEQCKEGKKVVIRPLAGTRHRGKTSQEDVELALELQNDPKEIAEHVMLIDLARNDIGRIAIAGSVKVTEQMVVEKYSHVMHLVSNVEGLLSDDVSLMDVLKATFPAGTLTGAPKVEAMKLIDDYEPVKRGIYGGACGYLSFHQHMDLAISIRTAVIQNQTLYAQASAGIVYDSIAENEWLETENKAKAVLKAAEMVENGF
jgi:anthranilate synthase component 1